MPHLQVCDCACATAELAVDVAGQAAIHLQKSPMQCLLHAAATLMAANTVAIADHVPGEDHWEVLLDKCRHKVACTGSKKGRATI
jgi:hypothetical protein